MIKNIIIPPYIFRGIVHNEIAFPKRYKLFGADTETVRGEPYTFQVSQDGKNADIVFVNSKNILDKFLSYMEPLLLQGRVNIMYFHNLSFDLAVILKKYQKLFAGNTRLEIKYKKYKFEFVIAKVYFGRIYFPANRVLTIVDSYAFFVNYKKTSLGNLAKELNLPYQKLGRLPSIGEKYYKKGSRDYKKFMEYSRMDAIVEWHLGKWIVDQYRQYNTRVCVSSPQFSMRVFRHYFLKKGDVIRFPPPEILRGCILSYHGGKNGFYVDGVTVVRRCSEVDVVSMYPYAMKSMPNFLKGKYVYTGKFLPDYEGVYCISGDVKDCKYPVIFNHIFSPLTGRIRNIWITSYELKEALRMKEIKLKKCWGYVWKPEKNLDRNPFKDFVDYFFKQKETATNPAQKILSKLILNSLYGKTIQTIEDDKGNGDFKPDNRLDKEKNIFLEVKGTNIFLAGGMFNPFIATLITGFARAYLHRLEHKYKALHSSTDSIKTIMPIKEDKRLGGIKLECQGKCILFRNKLYLHYDSKNKLKKFALHGFLGRAEKLKELFDKKENRYKTKHLFKVREALRQKKVPLSMQEVDRELLGVDFSKVTYI